MFGREFIDGRRREPMGTKRVDDMNNFELSEEINSYMFGEVNFCCYILEHYAARDNKEINDLSLKEQVSILRYVFEYDYDQFKRMYNNYIESELEKPENSAIRRGIDIIRNHVDRHYNNE